MDPASTAVAIDLGNVYLARGKTAEAEQIFSAALKLHPDNASLHYSLALALVHRDAEAAMDHARRATYSQDAGVRAEAERLMDSLANPAK